MPRSERENRGSSPRLPAIEESSSGLGLKSLKLATVVRIHIPQPIKYVEQGKGTS